MSRGNLHQDEYYGRLLGIKPSNGEIIWEATDTVILERKWPSVVFAELNYPLIWLPGDVDIFTVKFLLGCIRSINSLHENTELIVCLDSSKNTQVFIKCPRCENGHLINIYQDILYRCPTILNVCIHYSGIKSLVREFTPLLREFNPLLIEKK